MIIGNKNSDKKPLIIAEIGNNHEGNYETAVRLVNEAAKCGVDGVKFQTFKTEHYVSANDKTRFDRLKSFELTINQFEELSELAHSLDLLFISTPFDLESAKSLEPFIDAYKISSGDINFYPMIDVITSTNKPIILSTGASDIKQILCTVNYIENKWRDKDTKKLALLHCISCYPVPAEQVNLRSIEHLSRIFDYTIGYSDHVIGIEASLAAVALGAKIIEKHFTLDKSFSSFRDHQLSSDPQEMSELVNKAGLIYSFLGDDEKQIQPCEKDTSTAIRRSIVASRDLKEGNIISLSDMTWIRPSGGLNPGQENLLIGKKLKNSKFFGEPLFEDDIA